MLVLSRKIGESITINEDIKVTVVDIKGKTIRIGIAAPDDTKIYREEVFQKIKEENTSSASAEFDLSQVTQFVKDHIKS